MMRSATLVLLAFVSLAAFSLCSGGKDADNGIENAHKSESLSERDEASLSKHENDPFFGRRRRFYFRRRRSLVRRRRFYLRRRRSLVRRRRFYLRRRSIVRRRRFYLRRRRSYVRRRRFYVRRRSSLRRRRSYVRRSRRRSRLGCSGRSRYDRCGRFCKVVNGRLTDCCRVRKDFESMTTTEQRRYIRTFKTISTKQPYKRQYDRLIKMHATYFATRIHQKREFLPWHRWFNLQIENLLQKVNCRVTLPYWDWSLWSHAPWSRKIWNSYIGLGGNGRRSDRCVTSGLFRNGKWKTATGQCLRRGFNGIPPDAVQVAITLKEPSFQKFELMLRVNIHEAMHCFIGGTMCSRKSAEAPEFFLHHGFIDKIWAEYQDKSRIKKFAYFSSIYTRMVGVRYGPRSLLDNNKLPGGVRVCYKHPTVNKAARIRSYLSRLSLCQLQRLRRLAFSKTPASAKAMFRLSRRERALAKYLENVARKGVYSRRTSAKVSRNYSSLERLEGFKIPTTRRRAYGDSEEQD